MIHKIIGGKTISKNKKGKKLKTQRDVKNSIDYLLRINKSEEEKKFVRILSNTDENDILLFDKTHTKKTEKHPYVTGVLSFEEQNIEEEKKYKIINEFEEMMFAEIPPELRPPMIWIEHTDKNRLELNYVTFNKLNDGSTKTFYLNEVDRKLVNSFTEIINYEYGLSSPFSDENNKNLTNETELIPVKKEFIEYVNNEVLSAIATNKINNFDEMINYVKNDLNLEVTRVREKGISIRNPETGKPVQIKGEIYEKGRTYEDYRKNSTNNGVRTSEYIAEQLRRNEEIFNEQIKLKQSRNKEFTKRFIKRAEKRNSLSNEIREKENTITDQKNDEFHINEKLEYLDHSNFTSSDNNNDYEGVNNDANQQNKREKNQIEQNYGILLQRASSARKRASSLQNEQRENEERINSIKRNFDLFRRFSSIFNNVIKKLRIRNEIIREPSNERSEKPRPRPKSRGGFKY